MTTVFVHGLGQAPTAWDSVIEHLPEERSVKCISLPRLTKEQENTYDNLYASFERECTQAEESLHLCGLSLGAMLALNYAIRHPERVTDLVLIAPQYKIPRVLFSVQNTLFRFFPKGAFQKMGFSKRATLTLVRSMTRIDFTSELKKVSCPVHILCGQKDRVNQKAATQLAQLLPKATMALIADAGHEANTDAPEALADALRAFWLSTRTENAF